MDNVLTDSIAIISYLVQLFRWDWSGFWAGGKYRSSTVVNTTRPRMEPIQVAKQISSDSIDLIGDSPFLKYSRTDRPPVHFRNGDGSTPRPVGHLVGNSDQRWRCSGFSFGFGLLQRW